MKVTNITKGPKGLRDTTGKLIEIEAGQTVEIDIADGEEAGEWFEFGGKTKTAKADAKAE